MSETYWGKSTVRSELAPPFISTGDVPVISLVNGALLSICPCSSDVTPDKYPTSVLVAELSNISPLVPETKALSPVKLDIITLFTGFRVISV